MELLTAAEMRAIERAAIESGEVTGLELMERAGRGVVEAIFAEWPELGAAGGAAPGPPEYLATENAGGSGRRAVVLCGPGGNGGDGFVVARLLKERGWGVRVLGYGDPSGGSDDARENRERWCAMGEVEELDGLASLYSAAGGQVCDLVVDALFGIGMTREPGVILEDILRSVGRRSRGWPRVVAIDVPSGLDADSGRLSYASADLTVTFHKRKVGMSLAQGPEACGKVLVAPIGLEDRVEPHATLLLDRNLNLPDKSGGSGRLPGASEAAHKYTHGHALILSGPAARTGAARLAARGALRIGAGLVTVGAAREALAECAAQLTAVMLREVGGGAALAGVLEDARINAICLGPGLGLDERARGLVAAALGVGGEPAPGLTRGPDPAGLSLSDRGPGSGPGRVGQGPRPAVFDADALTILAQDPALFGALHDRCVLTPHHGEFGRLFPDIAEKLAAPATRGPSYSKVDAAREAAARAGCVVLYKGPDTVIAAPDGRCSINSAAYERAAPWLATAGSGDVLAGFIAGLLARGFAPLAAAGTAAWLHVECARSFGPGLIAEDLPEELPKVFRALGL